jgi:hypothetical protein
MGAQDQDQAGAEGGRGIDPSLGVALGVVAISFAPVFVEGIRPEELGPTGIALWRTALGGVALLALAVARRERLRPTRTVLGFALLAGALFAGDLWVWHRAIHRVGGGLATLLGNVQVFWTGLVGAFVLHERSGKRLLAAVPLAVAASRSRPGCSKAAPRAPTRRHRPRPLDQRVLRDVPRRAPRTTPRPPRSRRADDVDCSAAATCALLAPVDGTRAWPATTSAWALARASASSAKVSAGDHRDVVPGCPWAARPAASPPAAFSLVWAAWFFGRLTPPDRRPSSPLPRSTWLDARYPLPRRRRASD